MISEKIPYQFISRNSEIGWNELLFGLKHQLISEKAAIDKAVERLCGDARADGLAALGEHPLAHLGRRSACEGHHRHAAVGLAQDAQRLAHEGAGLAGPGWRHDQQMGVALHREFLIGIELGHGRQA